MSTLTPLRRAILVVGGFLALGVITCAVLSIVDSFGRTTTEQDRVLSNVVGTLDIDNTDGSIELVQTSGHDVRLHTTMEYGIFRPSLKIDQDDAGVHLSAGCNGWVPGGECHVHFRIEIPGDIPVSVSSTAGDITATNLTNNLTLRTTAGDIAVDHIKGTLNLRTGVGDVEGTDLTTPDVTAQTSAGDISLAFAQAPTTISATTSLGDVDLALPTDAHTTYKIDTDFGAGEVTIDKPLVDTRDSKRSVTARTSAGDINLHPIPPA